MPERIYKERTSSETSPADETPAAPPKSAHKTGEELKSEMDKLLDEIDGVLEENAEEFVAAYVQKGGE